MDWDRRLFENRPIVANTLRILSSLKLFGLLMGANSSVQFSLPALFAKTYFISNYCATCQRFSGKFKQISTKSCDVSEVPHCCCMVPIKLSDLSLFKNKHPAVYEATNLSFWIIKFMALEVLRSVLPKIRVLWNVTLYCWVSSSRRFEGSYCLHLQDQAGQEKSSRTPDPKKKALRSSETSGTT
jgi:hypothetical protein